MEFFKAAVLGIVQGATEFLPVSSSGHLILMRGMLGWDLLTDQHLNKMFDVALHAGTFVSLLAYFRSDIVRLFRAFTASLVHGVGGDTDRRLGWVMVVGTVPAAVAGVVGQEVIETRLGEPVLVAALLIVFGIVLWLADWKAAGRRGVRDVSWWDGVVVGVAQAMALAPGVSRSGITITAGLARGMTRETAARFSFLLSIPIVGGTVAYGFLDLVGRPQALSSEGVPIFAVGMVAAALSGYVCIRFFLGYLQTRRLLPFIVYRLALGMGLLSWLALAAR